MLPFDTVHSLFFALLDPTSGAIHDAEIILCCGVPLIRCFSIPVGSQFIISRNAVPVLVNPPELQLGVRIARFSLRLELNYLRTGKLGWGYRFLGGGGLPHDSVSRRLNKADGKG